MHIDLHLPQSEYYVYSLSGIVGTVGGSLGMFLGFSFWQSAVCIANRMIPPGKKKS